MIFTQEMTRDIAAYKTYLWSITWVVRAVALSGVTLEPDGD